MDEQIWDVHDLDDILDFSIDIIEFFKNDFLSIKIFLLQESVWDQQIMLKLSLSLNELKMNKHSMLKNMVMAYYSMVCESSMDPDKQIAKVDYPFITLLQRRINPIDIFVNENFCSTQMFRYYIELIKNRGSIKIDTYNNFQPEVMDFVSIYDTNYRKFKLNMVSERVDALDDKEIQDRYINFYRKIVKEAKDYIPTHFRDCVEEEDFINYLFSLYYTNLLDKQNKNEELDSDELQVMNSIENNKDLVEVFDFNPSIVILILEYLFNTYKENGLNYDKRQQVKDKKSRNYLRALDYNFDTKFDLDIIISDYTIDNKLTTILENFAIGKLTSLEIYQLLLDHMSIYDQLYQIGLDARGSDFYKILMIRKILSDVFMKVT